MKKGIFFLALLVFVTLGAFAELPPMSAGGGLLFDMSFRNGYEDPFRDWEGTFTQTVKNTSFGGFGFFDATFVEANISFAYGFLTYVEKLKGSKNEEDYRETEEIGTVMQLGLGIMVKYPFDMGTITVFPLFGINYNFILSGKDTDGNDISDVKDFSQFGVLGGLGLDFNLTNNLFLRGSALLHVRIPSKSSRDQADEIRGGRPILGFGPLVRLAVGYRF